MSANAGYESSKSSGRTNNTTTDTIDPRLAATLYGNIDKLSGGGYTPYTGQTVAGFNPDQQAAQDQARTAAGANIGGGTLAQAIQAATKGAGYTPGQVKGGGYDPFVASSVGMNRGDIRDVDYNNVDQAAIDRFMNPYTQNVVDRSTQNLEDARAREQSVNGGYAAKMGAARGTGLFNARDRTTEKFADAIGDTTANLNHQGFQTALDAARGEAGQQLGADALNQGQDANVAGTNASLQLQQAMDAARRNDAAGQFNATQDFNAQAFNANAGSDAAKTNLAGAGVLAGLSGTERDQAFGNIGVLGGVGDAIQGNTQAGLTAGLDEHLRTQGGALDWASLVNQGIGLIPQTGTRTSSGTESSKASGMTAGVAAQSPFGGK